MVSGGWWVDGERWVVGGTLALYKVAKLVHCVTLDSLVAHELFIMLEEVSTSGGR